jgi:hypothetical protein
MGKTRMETTTNALPIWDKRSAYRRLAPAAASFGDANSPLLEACSEGRLADAQQLVAAQGTPKCLKLALRHACRGGHADVAQWLIEAFDMPAEDVFRGDALALDVSHRLEHHEIVQLIVDHFGLTEEDVAGYPHMWENASPLVKSAAKM